MHHRYYNFKANLYFSVLFIFQFVEGFSRLGFKNDPYLQRKLKFIYQQYLLKYPVVSTSHQYLLRYLVGIFMVSKARFRFLSRGIPFGLVNDYSCAIKNYSHCTQKRTDRLLYPFPRQDQFPRQGSESVCVCVCMCVKHYILYFFVISEKFNIRSAHRSSAAGRRPISYLNDLTMNITRVSRTTSK